MSHFAKNLRFIRQKKQLSEADFALLLGIWEDTLKRYERAKAEPDLDTLVGMATALNLPIDHLLTRDLDLQSQRIASRRIKLVLLDVDGTLTDGRMYYSESGDQMKSFNVKDGMMIYRLISRQGMEFGLVSSGYLEKLMNNRAKTLGIQRVYGGTRPKVQVVNEWLEELNIRYDQVAYVGDDLNDLMLLKKVGVSACPADAVPQVKAHVDVVLSRPGGMGCVREFLEDHLGFSIE